MTTWLEICSKKQCSKKFSALSMTYKTSLNHGYLGTFCPEVEKQIVPPVSYWAALMIEIKLWWKYWLPPPKYILVVLISWNPIIPLAPSNNNPNYILQVGNVFGFIIFIGNTLWWTRVGWFPLLSFLSCRYIITQTKQRRRVIWKNPGGKSLFIAWRQAGYVFKWKSTF